jgi:hypothetical protein
MYAIYFVSDSRINDLTSFRVNKSNKNELIRSSNLSMQNLGYYCVPTLLHAGLIFPALIGSFNLTHLMILEIISIVLAEQLERGRQARACYSSSKVNLGSCGI